MRLLLVFCLAGSLVSAQEYSLKERVKEIRNLGKRDAQSIPTLANYLNDSDRDLRFEAVKAIVNIGTQASLDPLIKATRDDDSDVQIRATDGLVNFYQPGYVTRGLFSLPKKGIKQMKSYIAPRNDEAVAPGMFVRPEVGQALAEEVRHGVDFDSRANAALAAGILRAELAVPALVEALRAKNTNLIFESLVALQKIRDPAAGPSITFLANDPNESVQVVALETIGVLRSLQSAPEVRNVVDRPKNARVRRTALQALALLGMPGDRRVFQEYKDDRDSNLRAAAIEGLGRIRDPEDYPTIDTAFSANGTDMRVRLAGAFSQVMQGKVDTSEFGALRYLVNTLNSKNYADTAQTYLEELCRRPEVRQALLPVLPTGTKAEKIGLCQALASSGEPDVRPAIEGMTKDADGEVSLAATRSLRIIKTRVP